MLFSPSISQFIPFNPLFFTTTAPKFHVSATPIKHHHRNLVQIQGFPQTLTKDADSFSKIGEIREISEFNRLFMSLVSADDFESALRLNSSLTSSFGLNPNDLTYSILVNCYCRKNEPIEARSVVEQMLENGFDPNVATFTTLINTFCKNGRIQDAFQVFDKMCGIGCQPTINTYNCLLKGLCYVGRVEEAYNFMATIKKSSTKPDIYTYTAMMDGFCTVGRSSEAFELLNEAIEMDLTPTVVTYNTLFNAYFKEGKPLRGFGLLRKMRERNCEPDYICYSTLLHGLLKWGKMRAALQVYKEMVENGYRVDARMVNTLLRGLCRLAARKERDLLKDVYVLFEEMRSGNYDIGSAAYDLVIEACCVGGEINRVCDILSEMIGAGYSPKTFTFNIVIHGLCGVGEVDKALAVLMVMHKCRKAQGIPFNALIRVLNQQGRSLEARHIYGVALKRGVIPKMKPRTENLP